MLEVRSFMIVSPEELELLKRTNPSRYQELLVKLDEYEVSKARECPKAFCRYILRDEQTGGPLSWSPYHDDYVDFLNESDAAAVFGHVEMGKTQLGIGLLLWRLGHNSSLRILLLNAKATISQRTASTMRMHITNNERVRRVFPNLLPGTPWTDEEFCIQRRAGITTPTVVAAGVDSSIISFRFDIVWGDDVVNNENTQTTYLRKKTLDWFQNSPMSRTSRNMRVWITVNRWHVQDAAHMLARLPGWRSRTYPVGRKLPDGSILSYWPAHWPEERIKKEMSKRTPAEADRAFFCISYADSSSRVDPQWFTNALRRGRDIGDPDLTTWTEGIKLLDGEHAIIGVDLGLSDSKRSDRTSLCFMGMRPPKDGFEITDYEAIAAKGLLRGPSVRVFGFKTGQILIDEVFALIIRANYAFDKPPLIFVESVQAQRWLVDIISKSHPHIQIYPFLTRGRGTRANKNHNVFGVEGVFRAFATGEVDLISGADGVIDQEVGELIDECKQYSSESHTGDRLMSMWIGYTGGMAYILEHHIGYLGVDDIYTSAEAKDLDQPSDNQIGSAMSREIYDARRERVTDLYRDLIEEHQASLEGPETYVV